MLQVGATGIEEEGKVGRLRSGTYAHRHYTIRKLGWKSEHLAEHYFLYVCCPVSLAVVRLRSVNVTTE
jgi:hypothetical protein